MQTRAEQLCDLAANKETTIEQLRAFISEQAIDINECDRENQTAPVDFATQTGSAQTVRFFVEELSADLTARGAYNKQNLIQWSLDDRSDPATRIYLTDPDKQLWKKFNDGTNELHVFAFLGRLSEVAEILDREPDRICDLSNGQYNPLYYANIATHNRQHNEIQQFLLGKMQEYKQRHATNIENLFRYHRAMIFALAEIVEPYAEFDDFLIICIGIITLNPKMDKHIEKAFHIYSINNKNAINEELQRYHESENKSDKQNMLQRVIACSEQRRKVLEFKQNRNEEENSHINDLIISLLGYYCDICEDYQDRLKIELTADNYEWISIQNNFNNLYNYLDNANIANDCISEYIMDDNGLVQRKDMMNLFTGYRNFYKDKVKAVLQTNPTLDIKTNPLTALFHLLQERNTTVQQVDDYLQANPLDLAKSFRFDHVAADHAALHCNVAVTARVIESDLSALAIPPRTRRVSLMHRLINQTTMLPDVQKYILDPNRKLWEYFKDGTTDLMAHALAGRINAVTHLLIADEMRFLETNCHGENVFFWASYSRNSKELIEAITFIYDSFKIKMVEAGRWDTLLMLYKAMRTYLLTFSTKGVLTTSKRSADWLTKIKGDNSQAYIELKDYIMLKLADAHLDLDTGTDEVACMENDLAAKALLPQISNVTARDEMALQIQIEISKTHYRIAQKHDSKADNIAGDWNNDLDTKKFKEKLEQAICLIGDAIQALAEYPISIKSVGSLMKTYDEFKVNTQIKLDNADGFFGSMHSNHMEFESDEYYVKQIAESEARQKSKAEDEKEEEEEDKDDESMIATDSLSLSGNVSYSSYGFYKRKRSDEDDYPKPTNNAPRLGL